MFNLEINAWELALLLRGLAAIPRDTPPSYNVEAGIGSLMIKLKNLQMVEEDG